jgi:hypothetical protein
MYFVPYCRSISHLNLWRLKVIRTGIRQSGVFLPVLGLVFTLSLYGQSQPATSVPPLVRISNTFHPANGLPAAPVESVTFSVYNEQTGGTPLWQETQNVSVEAEGHYAALLGATQNDGVPLELFSSSEPRWLGVQFNRPGETEHPRVQLVSVPYALNAETLGGLPASAYLRAPSAASSSGSAAAVEAGAAAAAVSMFDQLKPHFASAGTANFLAMFTDGSGDIGNSVLMQSSSGAVGVGTQNPTPINASLLVPRMVITGTAGLQGVRTTNPGGSGSQIILSSTRGSDANTYTALQSGDGIGTFSFNGTDGTQFQPAVGVTAQVDGPVSTNNVPGRLLFATSPGGSNVVKERMRITSSGNVGIGTTTPGYTLDVAGPINGQSNGMFAGNLSVGGNLSVAGTTNIPNFQGTSTSSSGAAVTGTNTATTGYPVGVQGNVNGSVGAGISGNANQAGASGVSGYNSGTAGFAVGVNGGTNSPNGAGVFGSNNATSGSGGAGVAGLANLAGNFGVNGNNNATSGYAIGVNGYTASTSGAGVAGNASHAGASGVNGYNSATSGYAVGVQGNTSSTSGAGVQGGTNQAGAVGVAGNNNATSGYAVGVAGNTQSTGGAGVQGNAQQPGAFGVSGWNFTTSGYAVGTQGASSSPQGIGLLGVDWNCSGGSGCALVPGTALQLQTATTGTLIQGLTGTAGSINNSLTTVFSVDGTGNGTFANGVQAVSNGVLPGGNAGVAGFASATSGVTLGVGGVAVSPQGSGIAGLSGSCGNQSCTVLNGTAGSLYASNNNGGYLLRGYSGPQGSDFLSGTTQVFGVDGQGNVIVSNPGSGLILKSPNGTVCALISLANTGALTTTSVTCP